MASIGLKRFSTIDSLRKMKPDLLLQLISLFADYLESRGYNFGPNGNTLQYGKLSQILLSPNKDTPVKFIEALHLTTEMGTPKGMDAIVEELGDQYLLAYQRYTPLDVAVFTYLKEPETLLRLYAEVEVMRRRAFQYFVGYKSSSGKRKPDRTLEQDLSRFYHLFMRGDHCKISTFRRPSEVWLTVRHGEPFQSVVDLANNSARYVFRPECFSTIILDLDDFEMRINAATDQEVEIYRDLIGKHIYGSEFAFLPANKFTLSPLTDEGPACMATTDVPELQLALLTGVRWFVRHEKETTIENRIGKDLFGVYGEDVIPPDGIPVEATFKLYFKTGPRSVTIRVPNRAQFNRDSDSEAITRWLCARGFIMRSRQCVASSMAPEIRKEDDFPRFKGCDEDLSNWDEEDA